MKALWIGIGTVVLACGLMVSPASAAVELQVNVQLAGGGNSAIVDHVGQVVNFEVYAQLNGTGGAALDGLSYLSGALMSGKSGLLGDTAFTITNAGLLGGANAQQGTVQDLDGDTDLDVGGTSGNSSTGWIKAQVSLNPVMVDGSERILIGTGTFTVKNLDPGGTNLNWAYQVRTSGTKQTDNYRMGGTDFSVIGNDSRLGVGDGLSIAAVPEPATIAFLAIGALGLIRRKRA